MFVSQKRFLAVALASTLVFGSVSSISLAMQNPNPDIVQQGNQEAAKVKGNWADRTEVSWIYGFNTKFEISTPEQLAGLARIVNEGINLEDTTITLMNDLNMNGYIWTPIGNEGNSFLGTFDGNGKTISNLITDKNKDYQGLFGYSQGTIKNIGVINSEIKGRSYVGGIAAYVNQGEIENSYNKCTVTGASAVGGVVGFVRNGTIKNSYNKGNVKGDSHVGGIAGCVNHGEIIDIQNSGEVEGKSTYVGGIVGELYFGTMQNSRNLGPVISEGKDVGGIVGYLYGSIEDSCNIGNVRGLSCVGGVVGCDALNSYKKEIGIFNNCFNIGCVTGESNVGGVAGFNNALIQNSYNKGIIEDNEYVGGVVGRHNGPITDSYNLGNVKGNEYVGGIAGSNNGETTNSYNTGIIDGKVYFGEIQGNNNGQRIGNSYYCGEKKETEMGSKTLNGKSKTLDEMKDSQFAQCLGKAFIKSPDQNFNKGFPILKSHLKYDNRNGQINKIRKAKNLALKVKNLAKIKSDFERIGVQLNLE